MQQKCFCGRKQPKVNVERRVDQRQYWLTKFRYELTWYEFTSVRLVNIPSTTRAIRHSSRTTSTAAAFCPSSPATPPRNTMSIANDAPMMIASNICAHRNSYWRSVTQNRNIRVSFIYYVQGSTKHRYTLICSRLRPVGPDSNPNPNLTTKAVVPCQNKIILKNFSVLF